MTQKELIERILNKLDSMDDKLDKHGESIAGIIPETKSTQKELTEHKHNHWKFGTLVIGLSAAIMGIIKFIFGGK
jgi:hypothetical protein